MRKAIFTSMLLIVALSGCKTISSGGLEVSSSGDITVDGKSLGKAPAPKMPDLPPSLAKKAGALPPLTDPTVPGMQKDAIETDRRYNDVAHQLNNTIDAWNCVKSALNDGTDPKKCFGS